MNNEQLKPTEQNDSIDTQVTDAEEQLTVDVPVEIRAGVAAVALAGSTCSCRSLLA